MKKIQEFCSKCNKTTTHRVKKKSGKHIGSDTKSFGTINLAIKCMTCGYMDKPRIKEYKKKKQHISFN